MHTYVYISELCATRTYLSCALLHLAPQIESTRLKSADVRLRVTPTVSGWTTIQQARSSSKLARSSRCLGWITSLISELARGPG